MWCFLPRLKCPNLSTCMNVRSYMSSEVSTSIVLRSSYVYHLYLSTECAIYFLPGRYPPSTVEPELRPPPEPQEPPPPLFKEDTAKAVGREWTISSGVESKAASYSSTRSP